MILSGAHRGHRPSLPPLRKEVFRVSSLILQDFVFSGCFPIGLVYMAGVATLSHWCEKNPASLYTTKGSLAQTHHS
jgi:hypothetical protein